MADNVAFTVTGATYNAATDKVTYSGDSNVDVQLVRLVGVTGAEGSKTVTDVMGTAGSPGTAVITVQGVASGTTIPVTLQASTNTQEVVGDAAHDAAAAGNPVLIGGYASAAAPTDVSADADAVRLWLLRSGAAAVQPTFAGVLGVAGNGASGTGVQRVTIANDSTGILAAVTNVATIGTSVTPGTSAAHLGKAVDAVAGASDTGTLALAVRDDTLATLTPADGDYTQLRVTSTGALWVQNAGSSSILVDDAAFTPATSSVAVMGAQADEASTDSVDEGDAGALRMTLDRKLYTVPSPHTAGGLAVYKTLDLDETEEDVKTSAGQVYGCWVTNRATATRWLKFYNATAANVTVGTTTPVLTIGIPGNATDNIGAHFTMGGYGLAFDTAICIAATTGFADNDTGAPGANDLIVDVFYK